MWRKPPSPSSSSSNSTRRGSDGRVPTRAIRTPLPPPRATRHADRTGHQPARRPRRPCRGCPPRVPAGPRPGGDVAGRFTPAPGAVALTRAPHAGRPSTPVTVRFSIASGVPSAADNDQKAAGPQGMAVRFHLAEHEHTDIIAHSVNGFPARTGEEFLAFLRAAAGGGPGAPPRRRSSRSWPPTPPPSGTSRPRSRSP